MSSAFAWKESLADQTADYTIATGLFGDIQVLIGCHQKSLGQDSGIHGDGCKPDAY